MIAVADDIVTLLRAEADAHADGDWSDQVIRRRFTEAADEIERLRAAGDALVEALRGWCDGMDVFEEDQDRVRAWEEARRG